jgi:hypothetical protein
MLLFGSCCVVAFPLEDETFFNWKANGFFVCALLKIEILWNKRMTFGFLIESGRVPVGRNALVVFLYGIVIFAAFALTHVQNAERQCRYEQYSYSNTCYQNYVMRWYLVNRRGCGLIRRVWPVECRHVRVKTLIAKVTVVATVLGLRQDILVFGWDVGFDKAIAEADDISAKAVIWVFAAIVPETGLGRVV